MATTQQPDPFGAPPATTKGPSGPRAGFWARFGASILDGILIRDGEKQTWHDKMAGAVVVPTSSYPVG